MTTEYRCECGEPHGSYSAMMHCDCLDYDRNGRPIKRKGDDWLD